jgi:phasin family protein
MMERTHRASYVIAQHASENLTHVAQMTHIVAAGYPSIGSKFAEYVHQTTQRNVDTLNQLLQVRTVNDALQLQTQYLRDSLEAFLNTSAQIAQVATDTANEARQTLSKRKI